VSLESDLKANIERAKQAVRDTKRVTKEIEAKLKIIHLDRDKAAKARKPK